MRLVTDIDWREIDGEVVVLDRRERRYLAVHRSATVLWPALVEGTTEEGLGRPAGRALQPRPGQRAR